MVAMEVREGLAPIDLTDDEKQLQFCPEDKLRTETYLSSAGEGQQTYDNLLNLLFICILRGRTPGRKVWKVLKAASWASCFWLRKRTIEVFIFIEYQTHHGSSINIKQSINSPATENLPVPSM